MKRNKRSAYADRFAMRGGFHHVAATRIMPLYIGEPHEVYVVYRKVLAYNLIAGEYSVTSAMKQQSKRCT